MSIKDANVVAEATHLDGITIPTMRAPTPEISKPIESLADSLGVAPLQLKSSKLSWVLDYSRQLTSAIVAVKVGEDRIYHLHTSRLCNASKRMRNNLRGFFQESRLFFIDLSEEVPSLFDTFIEYLYIPEWTPPCDNGDDLVTLAQLYALGERLSANKFQKKVLGKFVEKIDRYSLETAQSCELLRVACCDITERIGPQDDAMRSYIFWLAASTLPNLREKPEFISLLKEHEDVGRHICMRAGRGSDGKPSLASFEQ